MIRCPAILQLRVLGANFDGENYILVGLKRFCSAVSRRFFDAAYGALAVTQSFVVGVCFHRPSAPAPSVIRQVLIVKLDELGDVLMALPFVAAIREQLPEAKIAIVLNSATCGVLQGAGDVTVLGVDVKCLKLLRPIFLPIRYFCFVRKNLSAQQFDVCFLPRRDADSVYSVLLAYLTRSSRRISFTEGTTPRKAVHNKSFDRLLTDVYPTPPIQHETVSNLSLLERIGLRPISTTAWLLLEKYLLRRGVLGL